MNPIAVDPLAILKALNRADNRNKPINDGFRIVDDSHDHLHPSEKRNGKRSTQPTPDHGCCSTKEKAPDTEKSPGGGSNAEIEQILPEIDLSSVNVFDPDSILEFLEKGYSDRESERSVENVSTHKAPEKQVQRGQDFGNDYLNLDLLFRDLKINEAGARKTDSKGVSTSDHHRHSDNGHENHDHESSQEQPVEIERKEKGCCSHKEAKAQEGSTFVPPLSNLDFRIERQRPEIEIVNPPVSNQSTWSRDYVPRYLDYRPTSPSISSQVLSGLLSRHRLQHQLDHQYPNRSVQRYRDSHHWLHHDRSSIIPHQRSSNIGSSILHSVIPHSHYGPTPLRYHHHH